MLDISSAATADKIRLQRIYNAFRLVAVPKSAAAKTCVNMCQRSARYEGIEEQF